MRATPALPPTTTPPVRVGRARSIRARLATVLAALLVLLVLTAPYDFGRLTPAAFVRIPLEALLVVALLLALPSRGSRLVATVTGVALGLLGLLKLLDLGFSAALSRAFDLVLDWALLDEAFAFLSESYGRPAAIGAAIALASGGSWACPSWSRCRCGGCAGW